MSDLSRIAAFKAVQRPEEISLFAEENEHLVDKSGVGVRYNLYKAFWWIRVFSDDYRPLFSEDTFLARFQHYGCSVLRIGVARSYRAVWSTRYFQYRPGKLVHF